jgi:hypothetical protein
MRRSSYLISGRPAAHINVRLHAMPHRRDSLRLIFLSTLAGFISVPIICDAMGTLNDDDAFDQEPTPKQLKAIQQLTPSEVIEIEGVLVSNVGPRWRKVAMVVGLSMLQLKDRFNGVPDVYYSRRLAEMAEAGKLDSQGDLRRMRFSEVRIHAS